jgi:hypothetical protein
MQTQSQQKQHIHQPFFKTSTSATSYFLNFNNSNSRTASQSPLQGNVSSLPQQQLNIRPVNPQGDTFFRQLTPVRQREKGEHKYSLHFYKKFIKLKPTTCEICFTYLMFHFICLIRLIVYPKLKISLNIYL